VREFSRKQTALRAAEPPAEETIPREKMEEINSIGLLIFIKGFAKRLKSWYFVCKFKTIRTVFEPPLSGKGTCDVKFRLLGAGVL